MTSSPPGRVVAIVGRPNVGKSAIFNRLLNRRVAIVHAEEGVTRDRLVREADWDGERCWLIDTGGLGRYDHRAATADAIAAGTRRQAEAAIEDAAVILMVTDLQAGLLPLDEDVAALLRRTGRPVLVVANKADHPGLDAAAQDFARLGYPVFPVAALHDRGFRELRAEILRRLPDTPNPTAASPLKVAVIGRPNAGKSSYINRLLGDERVIVSDKPGTTRDSVEVPFTVGAGEQARHYLLIDTAGLRDRTRVREAVESYSALRVEESIRRADVCALVLDGVAGPSRQDKKIADRVRDAATGCVVLVNKWDLAEGVKPAEYRAALLREMPFLSHVPIRFVSARTGHGVRASVDTIDQVAAQVSLTLSTGVLNRVLGGAVDRKSAPSIGGRRLKLYYATQTGVRPVTLRMFVNDPDLMPPAYAAYLEHQVRAAFGLEGAPLRFDLRARTRRP